MAMSNYEINFILEKGRKKNIVQGTFRKILAPLTIGRIVEKLPINERAILMDKNKLIFKANINSGPEKAVKTVEKGDICYRPLGDEVIIYMEDIEETYSRVNAIGKLENLEDIDNILKKILMSVKITVKLAD